ncbi:translational activator of cytochrome c oxidase 1-like [Polypterus senegalus]|uniref:translational activator of cytochrome c oxidase 1-like n=1 Tax=Polypterus senegalus TaxID=55291 RepID=UPI00196278C6|nr:translational activator of cytochrome c oxidase 1-like [Polypterus senegalus]XP_039595722.1 translational activator of cytochrome c oxidase 1-like [Polypterus senegalus]XP_039595723.1 translational activator of cytochrome c oxidase 1-like [Polypterus senegalus]XP_039595724.1 translational activator of cytochrome c oxidase 1-like [Polypterus senegalus]XP_039595725.1 translational activator of cytochrome c oxidase 1-like [Polypterus senegalus]
MAMAALHLALRGVCVHLRCQLLPPAHLRLPRALLHLSPPVSAGHNKWSKVKNIKGPKDAARSRLFLKFAMMIRLAVKDGGANPEFNQQLANVIEQCRAKNMPKASIEAAIKGTDKSNASVYSLYEARGPGGSSLLIEVLTDNSTRSHQAIKYILGKNGGSMCNGARHNFERKGVVLAAADDHEKSMVPLERALELAIEAGAEDVRDTEEEERPLLQFICDVSSVHSVRESLTALGVQTVSASLEYVPCTMAQLSDADLQSASRLIELLNDSQDVLRVYDNIEAQSEQD